MFHVLVLVHVGVHANVIQTVDIMAPVAPVLKANVQCPRWNFPTLPLVQKTYAWERKKNRKYPHSTEKRSMIGRLESYSKQNYLQRPSMEGHNLSAVWSAGKLGPS